MNLFNNLTKDTLHHAHLVIGDFDEVKRELFRFFENILEVSTKENEFFNFEKYDKFLVDDARKILDLHIRKTPQNVYKIIVVSFNFITHQAQNAILKMLEEPTERTYFFLIAPSKNLFVETILSRVLVIETSKSKIQNPKAEKFLKMNIAERMKFIAKLVKDIKDEKTVKQEAIDLLSGLEIELEKSKNFQDLRTILNARKYINLSGASVKILLETVALNV